MPDALLGAARRLMTKLGCARRRVAAKQVREVGVGGEEDYPESGHCFHSEKMRNHLRMLNCRLAGYDILLWPICVVFNI